jgi:hypothetical protein
LQPETAGTAPAFRRDHLAERLRKRMSNKDQLRTLEAELCSALIECKRQYGVSPDELRKRLTSIPSFLLLPDVEANELLDLDARASLFQASQRKRGQVEKARWERLDRKERRSAQKLADFLDSERMFPRQRPAEINTRLALYLIFVFEELLGERFPFSRSTGGGTPKGPAFRAVLAAMALAQARAPPYAHKSHKPNKAGLASIVEITRTKEFDQLLGQQGFRRTSNDVLGNSRSIALTVALARKRIVKARNRRRKKRVPTN